MTDPLVTPGWSPDPILGTGYVRREIPLRRNDARGGPDELVATLLHRIGSDAGGGADAPAGRPVLVLHGWSDYVFQRDLLEHLAARDLDVWALDLRRHGRSLRSGQVPSHAADLRLYDEELEAALAAIGSDRPPVLLGHSTGGLLAVDWTLRHPGTVAGLALNSPWLAFHLGPRGRRLVLPMLRSLARRHPEQRVLPRGSDHFARTLHRELGGDADYDLAWKPAHGHPMTAGTLAAVLAAQERVRAGRVDVPVLVLRSDRFLVRPRFDERMRRSDVILPVRGMDVAARGLGPRVRRAVIPGARHDVFLSEPDARDAALGALDAWLHELAEPPVTPADDAGR